MRIGVLPVFQKFKFSRPAGATPASRPGAAAAPTRPASTPGAASTGSPGASAARAGATTWGCCWTSTRNLNLNIFYLLKLFFWEIGTFFPKFILEEDATWESATGAPPAAPLERRRRRRFQGWRRRRRYLPSPSSRSDGQ